MHVCMYAHMCEGTCVSVHSRVSEVCVHVCTPRVRMCVCTYTHVCEVCVCMRVCDHTHVYLCVCRHEYMCVCVL